MNEQEFLHKISVETDINIELLKDVIHNEKFLTMLRARKVNDAIMLLRRDYVNMSLGRAKAIADAFSAGLENIQ